MCLFGRLLPQFQHCHQVGSLHFRLFNLVSQLGYSGSALDHFKLQFIDGVLQLHSFFPNLADVFAFSFGSFPQQDQLLAKFDPCFLELLRLSCDLEVFIRLNAQLFHFRAKLLEQLMVFDAQFTV